VYLCNAFSLNMLTNLNAEIFVRLITTEDVRDFNAESPLVSAVGHPDTARVFASELGLDVPENRVNIKLQAGERIIVGQYAGPRLEPGATTLPRGAGIAWLLVGVNSYIGEKPGGLWQCRACGKIWEGAKVFQDPQSTAIVWTCGDLACGGRCDPTE
jgi:hypothetical protein